MENDIKCFNRLYFNMCLTCFQSISAVTKIGIEAPQHQIWSPSLMLSPFQSSQVQLALRISASISITCCCAVLCSYALVKKFQTPVNHFVANLQFAILISCLAAVFGNAFVHSPLLCIIQGFILSSFILSAIIWFCSMAFHSYLYLFHYSQIDRFFKYYFAASFGVPPIMAAIPLADEGYSFSDFGLCYPRDDWVYIVYYGPLWLSMVFCIAIYIYIFYKLKRLCSHLPEACLSLQIQDPNSVRTKILMFIHRSCAYVGFYTLYGCIGTANKIVVQYWQRRFLFELQVAHILSASLCGALLSALFFKFVIWSSMHERRQKQIEKDSGESIAEVHVN